MILVLSKFLRHQAGSFSAAQKSRTEEVLGDGLISGFVGNIVNRSALKVGAWVGPATSGFQESGISQKATKMALGCILSGISHLSGLKL